jgi:hypothetical protein
MAASLTKKIELDEDIRNDAEKTTDQEEEEKLAEKFDVKLCEYQIVSIMTLNDRFHPSSNRDVVDNVHIPIGKHYNTKIDNDI